MHNLSYTVIGFTALAVAAILTFVIYFLPWLIARGRDMQNTTLLFWINLLLGWSIIMWIVCLIWAVLGQTRMQKRFYEQAFYRAH